MARIPFVKYHGAGNDFILIDDRSGQWGPQVNESWIAQVCHRRFGIGADGLILLQPGPEGSDFFMKYYNSDGRTSTFCGNGGRCIVSFAESLGINNSKYHFQAIDGLHDASINSDGSIRLGMIDVKKIDRINPDSYSLFTGSPHYVTFINDVDIVDVKKEGRAIRNSSPFLEEGINVNFVQSISPSEIKIRTYERGVEDETMACGTGVVAAAIANAFHQDDSLGKCVVHAAGGDLRVEYIRSGQQYFREIKLIGPAIEVFRGEIEI